MSEKRLWWKDRSLEAMRTDDLWEEPWWEKLWEDDGDTDPRVKRHRSRRRFREEAKRDNRIDDQRGGEQEFDRKAARQRHADGRQYDTFDEESEE
jgi:hypothetical protein